MSERGSELIDAVVEDLNRLREYVEKLEQKLGERASTSTTPTKTPALVPTFPVPKELDAEEFRAFLEKPYLIMPKERDEYYVIVPRFVDFHVGWLERQTESYNIFVINRYTRWFSELPEELRPLFEEPRRATVEGNHLKTSPEDRDHFWRKYRKHLSRREGEDIIRIKRGHEFELIAELVADGVLPFKPQPVDERDLRDWDGIALRDYQREAWNAFLEKGTIGIFWPPGVGKSYFGVYVLARVKGKKLVVVPTRTLVEQWKERIREHIPEYGGEVEVTTYASFHKIRNKEYALVIFDEVHHLPAPTYVRLSTLKRKYTLGLSASPYREDGKEAYILALTGFPVGLDWSAFLRRGLLSNPIFRERVVRSDQEKVELVEELVADGKKTLIFCDSITLGQRIAKRLGVPFVYSRTRNRMDALRKSRAVVVSRVGDEGVSLSDVERVVEVAFLGKSRRQQTQRFGRLLHSKRGVEHTLLMTREEFEKFYPRVYAVEEKGFKVVVEGEKA